MARKKRIESRLAEIGALRWSRAFCKIEGSLLSQVIARAAAFGDARARDPSVVRVRHRLWSVLVDTLGLSLSGCAALFEVNHVTVLHAVRAHRNAIEALHNQ